MFRTSNSQLRRWVLVTLVLLGSLCVGEFRSVAAKDKSRPTAVKDKKTGPPPGVIGAFEIGGTTASEERIYCALDAPTEVQLIATPLEDAMAYLSELHNIPIILDEVALGDEGIANDEPINLTLAGIRLRSVLKLILEPLGLDYVVEDDVMKITTQAVADTTLQTRVYDVRRLEKAGLDSETLAHIITRTIRPESWKPEVTSASLLPDGKTVALKNDERAVECWNTNTGKRTVVFHDGTGATLETLPGCLIVRHTQSAQFEIITLLKKLSRFCQST